MPVLDAPLCGVLSGFGVRELLFPLFELGGEGRLLLRGVPGRVFQLREGLLILRDVGLRRRDAVGVCE